MQTDRLILRSWLDSDAEALFRYASDPEVGPLAGWQPHKSKEESLAVIRNIFSNGHTWAIVPKSVGEAAGSICYYTQAESNIAIGKNDCEVGLWVAKPYWNQGIATQALQCMLDYCLNTKHFDNIFADCSAENKASIRLMEKCGFVDAGLINSNSKLLGADRAQVKIYLLKQ